jgi:hypothetical protein
MKGIRTIDDLIKAKRLTPEEEEQLRDIIEECKLREQQIKEASDSARRNLEALTMAFGTIIGAIATVNQGIGDLHDEVERLQLKLMPEEHFFRE